MQRASGKGHLTLIAESRLITRIKLAWPFAVLLGTLLVTFWPILFGGYTLYPSDILHELYLPFAAGKTGTNVQVTSIVDYVDSYYGRYWFLSQSLRYGQFPLWNPYTYGGHPQFASQGSIVTLNPFNVLFFWPDLPTALAWRTFLQVLACALFMFLYLRHLRFVSSVAVVGSLAYTLNSMFWVNIFDWSLPGFLWLPLVLLLFDRAIETALPRYASAAGLALGLGLLASPLQIYFYLCFTLLSIYALKWLLLERTWAKFKTYLVYGLLVAMIGIGLSAIQLLPALELITQSIRKLGHGGTLVRTPVQMVIASGALITFVFPNLGGRIKDAMMLAQAWGGTTHWQGYIGLLPFVLAVVGALASRDRRRLPFIVLAVVVIITVVYTPLVDFVYERLFLVYIFCASILAAFGAQAVISAALDQQRVRVALRMVTLLFTVVLFVYVIASIALWVFGPTLVPGAEAHMVSILSNRYFGNNIALHLVKLHNLLSDFTLTSSNAFVPMGLGFASLALVCATVRGRVSSRVFGYLAVTLVALDMSFATLTHVPLVDLERFPLFPAHPAIELIQRDSGLFRVIGLRQPGVEPPVLDAMTLSPYGLQHLSGDDNLFPPNMAMLGFYAEGSEFDPPLDLRLADLLNLKYIVTGPQTDLPVNHFRWLYDREVRVYENLQVMPRAFFVEDFETVSNLSVAMAKLRSSAFDPRQVVLLEQAPEGMMSESVHETEGVSAEVSVVTYKPQEVLVMVKSPNSGFLVLSDTYYPGWKATVDGQPSTILRANGTMRAVFVTAGEHWVRFVFEPFTFRVGLLISISAAVLAAILVVIGFFRRVQ